MSVLEINNLKFSYGDKQLFNSLNMRLFASDHLGLVGMNGVGKTTLLNLIAGKIDPDEGSIKWLSGVNYSYLDQHLKVYDSLTIYEYLYKVYDELYEIEDRMNKLYKSLETAHESEYDKILNKAYNLQMILEEKEFYSIKSKITNVISGLGINLDSNSILKKLSGGQRVKVFLAKMLLEEKDVLLLDEPTNFLDINHIEWLSKYLINYPKAFIVISHNKEFLDSVCNVIAELNNQQLTIYKGNYSNYLKQKELVDAKYVQDFLAQQKLIKKTEDFIQKNIVRASTSKQAQSRRKMLDKIDVLAKPTATKKIKFTFPFSRSFNSDAIVIKDLEIGYSKVLLPKINLKVRFGERIVIVGKNGVGKTTFLKTILGITPALGGKIKISPLNNVTYFSQEVPPMEMNAIEYIQESYPLMETKKVRDILGSYGVSGELSLKPLSQLSGGELTKVRFALLSLSDSNLLILDEPTNHLDVNAKKALLSALDAYPGTIIIVSHEKGFYRELNMKEIVFS